MTSVLAPPSLLIFPDDPAYDEARVAWNLAVDQRPAAVALPETADDIVAAVRAARELGLRVAAQGTGHNAGPLGDLSDTVLIKTHRMRDVEIDAPMRVARVEAGALWEDVVGPAAAHGLAALHGSSPDVGVVGYTLGGGLSFYGRRYGTASSRVLAMDVVTADGELVRADRRENADLFHAMRGGGGAFGIVAAMEFELFDPGEIQAGHLFFPLDRGREVFKVWARWAPTLPDYVTTIARALRIPDMDGPPEFLRGKEFAVVQTIVLGSAEETDAFMAEIRALGPVIDTMGTIPKEGLAHLHMDPPEPVPGAADHQAFEALSDEAIDTLFDNLGPSLLAYDIRYGGARVAELGGPYLGFGVGIAPTPEIKAAVEGDLAHLRTALGPYASNRQYLNFAEKKAEGDLWHPEFHERLRRTKAIVDPHDVIRSNHPVV
jgi:FAD binding domain-containing protein